METQKIKTQSTVPAPDDREDFAIWWCMMHHIDMPSEAMIFKLTMLAEIRKAGIYGTVGQPEDRKQEEEDTILNMMLYWMLAILAIMGSVGIVAALIYLQELLTQ